jgi:hypothetical protein
VAGCCGRGDELSSSIKFGETFDFVSNCFVTVLTTNFILWTQLQFHEAFTRFCILSTDGNITHVQVAEVSSLLHNTTHTTVRIVLAELNMEVVQLFRSVGLTLAHSVQRDIGALYAVLIILSS